MLVKIGEVYADSVELRDRLKNALEKEGFTMALQRETGLIVMETIPEGEEK